jgi:hypothetical protein
MIRRMMTIPLASQPIWFHRESGSQLTSPVSPWKSQKAICAFMKMRVARFATNMSLNFPPQELLKNFAAGSAFGNSGLEQRTSAVETGQILATCF